MFDEAINEMGIKIKFNIPGVTSHKRHGSLGHVVGREFGKTFKPVTTGAKQVGHAAASVVHTAEKVGKHVVGWGGDIFDTLGMLTKMLPLILIVTGIGLVSKIFKR